MRATYQRLDTTPSSIDNPDDAQQIGYLPGCSASTTVVNGNQIITANIGNTSAFIALYDKKGSLIVLEELTNYGDSNTRDIYLTHQLAFSKPKIKAFEIGSTYDNKDVARFEVITTNVGFNYAAFGTDTFTTTKDTIEETINNLPQKTSLAQSLIQKAYESKQENSIKVMARSFDYPNRTTKIFGVFEKSKTLLTEVYDIKKHFKSNFASNFISLNDDVDDVKSIESIDITQIGYSNKSVVVPEDVSPSEEYLTFTISDCEVQPLKSNTETYLSSNLKLNLIRLAIGLLLVAAVLTIVALTANMGIIPAVETAVNLLSSAEKIAVIVAGVVTAVGAGVGLVATKTYPGLFICGGDEGLDIHYYDTSSLNSSTFD